MGERIRLLSKTNGTLTLTIVALYMVAPHPFLAPTFALDESRSVRNGKALLLEERWGEAKKAFDSALIVDPNNVEALIGRAECFSEMDLRDKAQDDVNKAIGLAPKNARCYLVRARMYVLRK